MTRTHIVNLYGGPGTGKSTTAAAIFVHLKRAGVNAELVREVAKHYAWRGQPITEADQWPIFMEQRRLVEELLGKVDVIVSDSPLLLGEYFSGHFGQLEVSRGLKVARQTFDAQLARFGHTQQHVFLQRSKPYNPAGRFQTENEARAMDAEQYALALRTYDVIDTIGTTEANVSWFAGCLVDRVRRVA